MSSCRRPSAVRRVARGVAMGRAERRGQFHPGAAGEEGTQQPDGDIL